MDQHTGKGKALLFAADRTEPIVLFRQCGQ
jgi:hypothetical protein